VRLVQAAKRPAREGLGVAAAWKTGEAITIRAVPKIR